MQEVWNKFNPRERLTAIGAGIVILAWLVGLVGSYGFGSSIVALLGAIAVLVILYLKYAPNQSITWPAPIPLIVLVIAAIVALLALLGLIQGLQIFGVGLGSFLGLYLVSIVLNVIGAAVMTWGAWQEYQLTQSTGTTRGSTGTTAPPPAPMAPPPPAPMAPPPPPAPPAQSPSDTDQMPPA